MISHVAVRIKNTFSYIAFLFFITAITGCGRNDKQSSSDQRQRQIDHLRSLPYVGGTNAPQDDPTGVVSLDLRRACPGYRIFTLQRLGRTELINIEGDLLREWQYQAGDSWARSELLPNGDLLVVGMESRESQDDEKTKQSIADSSRYAMRLDWNNHLVWKQMLPAHHDIELMPEGRILLLTFNRRMDTGIHPTIETRDDQMTLLDQNGRVVESRSMLESINNAPEIFPLQKVAPSTERASPWVDLFHSNSIEWMYHSNLFSKHPIYGPDNVLVSFRHQDRIAIFNWKEKRVVWSWGIDQLDGPHDAQVLENGHILLFDNGLSRGWSRAVELDPLTKEIVWEYRGDPKESFYTKSKGSVQRLPNGNTLIAESDKGRAIEITTDGSVVWEYICPYSAGQYNRAAIVRMVHHSHESLAQLLPASE